MNQTQTKTIKVKVETCLATEFCDEWFIPYVFCKIIIKKCLKTGKEKKMPECIPEGWQNWTYEECIEHNRNVKFQATHINILLKGSAFCVIDFDSKEDIGPYLPLFGDDWKSKSSARGLPHLWRRKESNDYSKCTTAIEIEGKKTHIDIKYFNIFERIDSKIEYSQQELPFFDFQKYHNSPISEKPRPKEERLPSNNYTLSLNDYLIQRVLNHLKNIAEQDIAEYTDWFKIGRAIKNVFKDVPADAGCIPFWLEVLSQWSKLSKQHLDEDEDKWQPMFDGESKCGLPTILQYSQKGNSNHYDQIERDYYTAKREDMSTPENIERKLIRAEGFKKLFEIIEVLDQEQEAVKKQYPSYADVKEEFEKTYALIRNIGIYIQETPNGIIFYTTAIFNVGHKMLKYWTLKDDKYISQCFIEKWTVDENIRKYDSCDTFPPPHEELCPSTVFNLWKPFYISTLKGNYTPCQEALLMFKQHIAILCNHQAEVADYILKWIGQMLLYPAIKTICPTFISVEGAGKGTLLEVIRVMMGQNKVMETTSPSETVWGKFNELMDSCFLVNLNEMCRKEAENAEGKIKGLITDKALYVNKKGISRIEIKSYHRFLITTNVDDPIKTKKGDRRNLIINCSDELSRENNPNVIKEYFVPFNKTCLSIEGLRTIYDWLIAQKDLDTFNQLPIPRTKYQEDMKEAAKSYYETWVEEWVRDYQDEGFADAKLEMKAKDILVAFHEYTTKYHIKFDTNIVKVGLAFTRLSFQGGITKKSKMNGAPFVFDMAILRKHFMCGSQIEG